MATALLLHNPTAGDEDHSKKKLVELIKSFGYEVKYYSTDVPGWERFVKVDAEKIFIAGGDGTVQGVAKELLKAEPGIRKTPVQVLPMGTANNIATTLKLEMDPRKLTNNEKTVSFDTGEVTGIGEINFFIEGLGFGIFPKLVKEMEAKEEPDDPEEELKQSLEQLLEIVKDYEAKEAIIIADGEEITGKYLLLECMNIRYIGPNFELAPNAQTGDGEFELVAVPEDGREKLMGYIEHLLDPSKKDFPLEDFAQLRKVKQLRLKWQGTDLHVDDEVELNYDNEEIEVKNNPGSFIFNVPE